MFRSCFASVITLTVAVCAWSQVDTARLQGTVVDSSGAAVPEAVVKVTNVATGRVVTAQTNDTDGGYSLPGLLVGRYRVEVSKTGFNGVTQEVTLAVAQVANLNFTLAPGDVTQVVTVSEEGALVSAASSDIGTTVQSRQIAELPLNGRNFTQLALLVPGVTRGIPDGDATGGRGNTETFRNASSGGAALSVNGLRPQANNFVLDGLDNNESLVNTIVFFPPAEAIQEFKMNTSVAPAQFGRAGGAIVNTAIKSGQNELHGSAFEFIRNARLDARPSLAPTKDPFRRNQFGATLGGPIVPNRLFFFGDYQGLRQSLPLQTEYASVPTAEFREGNFARLLDPSSSGLPAPVVIRDLATGQPFPNNIIPADRINRAGRNYLQAFPAPNFGGGRVQQNYVTQRSQVQSFNDFDIRIDYNIRDADQLFGRFSYAQDPSTTSSRLPALPAGFGSGQNFNHARGIALGTTHIFNPSVINELRLGYTRVRFGYTPPFNDRAVSAELGIPNANTSRLLGGGALIGGFNNQLEYTGDFGPYLVPENTYQISDAVSLIHGQHNVRAGATVIWRQVNLFRPNRGKGFFSLFGDGQGPGSTGYEAADVLAGFVNNYTIGPPFGFVGTRNWETGFYLQDDWRILRKLTLNLGVRYDLYTWPTEQYGRQANFDRATGALVLSGQGGYPESLIHTDTNNFAPRVGFAYDVFGNGSMAVRGGYGIFYFLDRGGIDNQLAQNPPFSGFAQFNYTDGYRIALSGRAPDGSLNSTLATGPLPLGLLTGLDLARPRNVTVFSANPNNVNSSVQQWNLQVEKQVGSSSVFNIAYVGTAGRHLMMYYNLNRQQFGRPSGTRLFPELGDINAQDSRGNSVYHGLQTQFERRFSGGLQLLAAYTWSHAIDDTNGAFDAVQPQDLGNLRLERASSSYDTRHRFVVSSLYQLPFGRGRRFAQQMPAVVEKVLGGWQANGILVVQTGFPFSVTTPGQPSAQSPFVRADVVGTLKVYPGNPNRYFDTTAFAAAPVAADGVLLRPGTAGRNLLVGPGTRNLDFSLFKDFRVERVTAQFRTEFFNLTNTPQYGQPQAQVGSGDFGAIRSTRLSSERQIQFALRLIW